MARDLVDGVRVVAASDVAARVRAVVEGARASVAVVCDRIDRDPGLVESLIAKRRAGVDVSVVVDVGQVRVQAAALLRLADAGVAVCARALRGACLCVAEDVAIEVPAGFASAGFTDVPRDAAAVTVARRDGADGRWARLAARAKLAKLGSRGRALRVAGVRQRESFREAVRVFLSG